MYRLATEIGKGGTGKSTLAVHIAAALAMAGARVLLVDTDMQADATEMLGQFPQPHFYDWVVRPNHWKNFVVPITPDVYAPGAKSEGRLFLMPSNKESRNVSDMMESEAVIPRRIRELNGVFDVVIFDTPPLADPLHSSINAACNDVLIVSQCEAASSFRALGETVDRIKNIQDNARKHGLEVSNFLGIVPNMKRNTVLHDDILAATQEEYGKVRDGGLVWEPIPLLTAFGEAAALQTTVFAHAPGTKADRKMRTITDRVVERATGVLA